MNNQQHWQTVYTTRQPHEVSWTQEIPQTSLDFINNVKPNPPCVSLILVVATVIW
jgi:hypothetical protein